MFGESSYHIQIWIVCSLFFFSNFCLNCFSDRQFTCLQVRLHVRFLILRYKVRGILERMGKYGLSALSFSFRISVSIASLIADLHAYTSQITCKVSDTAIKS